jgi:enoyl-CoA hydratase/carnithine racemase
MNDIPQADALAPCVLREDRPGVATLTLNRPESINSLSIAMVAALQVELDKLAGDDSVQVVVLAAAGKHFCAGHDLREIRERRDRAALARLFEGCNRMMMSLLRLPQPVIARVQGVATAAGCQLVAQCDLAVAADVARFALPGANVGLFCSTPAVAVGRNVGRKHAMELLLTGDMIDAPTALAWGLVNRVVPLAGLEAAVGELADKIRSKSPLSIRLGKKTFYEQLERGIAGAYEQAADTMTCNTLSEDTVEGIEAFFGKRPPQWRGK